MDRFSPNCPTFESMENVIIYGAYGYTGKLIVELAVSKGYTPTLAGRNEEKLAEVARSVDLPYRCFRYDDQNAWDRILPQFDLLINCAGPFSLTIDQILPACIRNNTHYTDITGEIEAFEFIYQHHNIAKSKGITLMPGVGFDVVPTDCMAVFLHEKLPSANHLELAFKSYSGLSRGTALSLLNRLPKGSAYRKDGKLVPAAEATVSKSIHLYGKDRLAVRIVWGDLFTAFRSTGIPNIEVYNLMNEKTMKVLRRAGKLAIIFRNSMVQHLGRKVIKRKIDGPSKATRETSHCYIYGKVWDDHGNVFQAQMKTPESYKLTAITALMCAERILAGDAPSGYTTPAQAFGPDLILGVEGVEREMC